MKRPVLGSRTAKDATVAAAIAVGSSDTLDLDTPEKATPLSVRLPPATYGALLDMVTAGKKRGEKISIHSLILEGIALRIAKGE